MRAGAETTVAANVTSDEPITRIDVFLDGTRIDVEVGGRSETEQAFFTGRTFAVGTHRVRVVAADRGGDTADVTWRFTASASATATPAPASGAGQPPAQAPTATAGTGGRTSSPTPVATPTGVPSDSQAPTATPTGTVTASPTDQATATSEPVDGPVVDEVTATPAGGLALATPSVGAFPTAPATPSASGALPFAGGPPIAAILMFVGAVGAVATALGLRVVRE